MNNGPLCRRSSAYATRTTGFKKRLRRGNQAAQWCTTLMLVMCGGSRTFCVSVHPSQRK